MKHAAGTNIFTGSRVRQIISGRATGGQFCMLEFTGPAGRGTPLHMHDRETESVYLLAGELDVTIEDHVVRLTPGDSMVLPPKLAHRLQTAGDVDARYIVVCTPAGFDDFVAQCVTPDDGTWPPAPPSKAMIDNLLAEAPKFGITILPSKPAA